MSVSSTPKVSTNSLAPFLDHLSIAQEEAYQAIERVSSPFELLDSYIPSKSKKEGETSNTLFSKVYDYFIGNYEAIDLGIKERQNKLVAESLTLADLCEDLPMNSSMREDFCNQLDQINLNRVEALNHLSELNTVVCLTKIAFSGLTAALSLGFVIRVIQDYSNNCSPNTAFDQVRAQLLEQCPSITNPSYFTSTAFDYLAPVFLTYAVLNQLNEGGFLSAVFDNPVSQRMAAYNRLSLGVLTRVSSIKDRILGLVSRR